MNFKERYNSVHKAIQNVIREISGAEDSSYVKAQLAYLRNSIGGKAGKLVYVWPILLKHIPEECIGNKAELTDEEKAVLHTMQLYSLAMQGNNKSLKAIKSENRWENMGTSFSKLRNQYKDKVAIDKRFNAMIMAETYDEFLYHLRQMIRILKSKTKTQIEIDFSKLGGDLFKFLYGKEDEIKFSWLKQYYRDKNITNRENSEGEKND